MIDQIIRTLKGVIPEGTWDFIFEQFKPHQVKFSQPQYKAVRVSNKYMLVQVEKQETP